MAKNITRVVVKLLLKNDLPIIKTIYQRKYKNEMELSKES